MDRPSDAHPSFLGRCCCSVDESACLHLPFKPCVESNSSPSTCLSARISTSIPACVQWPDKRGEHCNCTVPLSISMQDMLYENSNAALKLVVTHLEEHAANAVFLLKAQAARAIPAPLKLAAMLSNCRMQEQMVILGTHTHGAGEAWGDITVLGLLSI